MKLFNRTKKHAPKKRKKVAKRKTRRAKRAVKTPRINFSLIPWKPALGLLMGTLMVIWWLQYDPAGWFRLGKLTISGPTQHLSMDEIAALTAPTLGQPLLALDLDRSGRLECRVRAGARRGQEELRCRA